MDRTAAAAVLTLLLLLDVVGGNCFGASHTPRRALLRGDVSDGEHHQSMCREPVVKENLDCHILARVGKVDPYLLHKQHIRGQLPAVPFDPERDCNLTSAFKRVYDKIRVAAARRPRPPGARILCMIVTTADKHDSDLRDVRMTWGRSCDGFVAFSNAVQRELSAIETPVAGGDSYKNLGEKTRAMFKFAWYHYGNKFDWFMKADDDTFVIVDNLVEYLLSPEVSAARAAGKGVYLGHRLKIPGHRETYTSGGAGYVLDRVAVREFVKNIDTAKCTSGAEDVEVGQCLLLSGISPFQTTDAAGEEIFHLFNPQTTIGYRPSPQGGNQDWYTRYRKEFGTMKVGLDAISENSTTFHYMRAGVQEQAYKYLAHCRDGAR